MLLACLQTTKLNVLQGLKRLLLAATKWVPGLRVLVTLRAPAVSALPPGPCLAEHVGVLSALEAEELLQRLVPAVRYPDLMDLAEACGHTPAMLAVIAGAMNDQNLTIQVWFLSLIGLKCHEDSS